MLTADEIITDADELDFPDTTEEPDFAVSALNEQNDQWLWIINLVNYSGVSNKDGCRIKINDKWNFDLLEKLLIGYEDMEIIDLKYPTIDMVCRKIYEMHTDHPGGTDLIVPRRHVTCIPPDICLSQKCSIIGI